MLNRHSVKGSLRVVVLSLAISAVFGAGAAAAHAEGPFWYTGSTSGSLTKLTGSKTVLASAGESKFETGKNKGKTLVGFALNTSESLAFYRIGLFATGIEFKQTTAFNTSALGKVQGKLILTGVTTNEPVCEIENHRIESNPVVQIPRNVGGVNYVEIAAAAGPEYSVMSVPITECIDSGNYVVKGAFAAEDSSYFESGLSHTLKLSQSIQAASKMNATYYGQPAWAEGTIVEHLAEPLYWALK